ncbi:MAG: RNA polymerase sigma factor [Streptosporangiales bacterium]
MSPPAPGGGERVEPAPIGSLATARDRALVRRLGGRDRRAADALSALFRNYGPAAMALARRVTRQNQLAEDSVQEAFLGLWRAPESYDSRRGTVRAFLLTAVHRRAVDAVRREEAQHRRQDEQIGEEADEPDVADEVTQRAEVHRRHAAVAAALAGLPEEQRMVVRLMYFDGKTQRVIAEELGVPLGTVKSRALLAMRRLRTALAGEQWGSVS